MGAVSITHSNRLGAVRCTYNELSEGELLLEDGESEERNESLDGEADSEEGELDVELAVLDDLRNGQRLARRPGDGVDEVMAGGRLEVAIGRVTECKSIR